MNKLNFPNSLSKQFVFVLAFFTLVWASPAVSQSIVCLDFDGHTIPNWEGSEVKMPPFNHRTSDPATLDAAEQADVDQILRIVREDFSPFNIDVRTEEPPTDDGAPRMTAGCPASLPKGVGVRAVIGGFSTVIRDGFNEAGYALRGSYRSASSDMPNVALVFPYKLSNPVSDPAWSIGNTTSHEIGHVLGLGHLFTFVNSMSTGPRVGNTFLSSIMNTDPNAILANGTLFTTGAQRTTWAVGPVGPLMDGDNLVEAGGPPAWQQDDMQIIGAYSPSDLPDFFNCIFTPARAAALEMLGHSCTPVTPNQIGYRVDDHGDYAGAATALTANGPSFWEANGIIEKPRDVDYFRFQIPRGADPTALVSVSAFFKVNADSTNLNAVLEIRDYSGTHTYRVGERTPLDKLDISITDLHLPPGEYSILVRSQGDPGNTGQYQLRVVFGSSNPFITDHVLMKDRLRLTFNELIDLSTFSPEDGDVHIEDGAGNDIPRGDIDVSAVSTLARTYDVTFPQYTTQDGIRICVGWDIRNLSNEPIDQNGDTISDERDIYCVEEFTAPRVTRVELKNNHIDLQFDEALNPATVNTQTVRTYDGQNRLQLNHNMTPVRINDAQYEQPTNYPSIRGQGFIIDLSAGITDAFGNALIPAQYEFDDQSGPHVSGAGYLGGDYALPGLGRTFNQSAVLVAFDEVISEDSLNQANGQSLAITYYPPTQVTGVKLNGIDVPIDNISSYEAGGFQDSGSDRMWLLSFVPVNGFDGHYELRVGTQVTDLFLNPMNQDGDGINGEAFQDVFHYEFEVPPDFSSREDIGMTDAYRLAGRILWGDGWLLDHYLPSTKMLEGDPLGE